MNTKIYLCLSIYLVMNGCAGKSQKEEMKYSHAYVESSFSTDYINHLFNAKSELISEDDLKTELDCQENKVIDTLYFDQENVFVTKCTNKDKKAVVTYLNRNKTVLLAVNFIQIDMTQIFFLQEEKFSKLIGEIISHEKFILNMQAP